MHNEPTVKPTLVKHEEQIFETFRQTAAGLVFALRATQYSSPLFGPIPHENLTVYNHILKTFVAHLKTVGYKVLALLMWVAAMLVLSSCNYWRKKLIYKIEASQEVMIPAFLSVYLTFCSRYLKGSFNPSNYVCKTRNCFLSRTLLKLKYQLKIEHTLKKNHESFYLQNILI